LPSAMPGALAGVHTTLGAAGRPLLVLGGSDTAVKRAAANLPKVRTVAPGSTNLLDVLNHRWLLLTEDAVTALTRTLTTGLRSADETGSEPPRPAAETPSAANAPTRRMRRRAMEQATEGGEAS
jgi:hypothetical protein